MPVVGVGLAVERDVVDPHVEVRPVNADEKHQATQRRIPSGPRQNKANANGDFHHAGNEHPNGWVAQHGWNDGFKPGGVGEVLNTNVDVHAAKNDGKKAQQAFSSDNQCLSPVGMASTALLDSTDGVERVALMHQIAYAGLATMCVNRCQSTMLDANEMLDVVQETVIQSPVDVGLTVLTLLIFSMVFSVRKIILGFSGGRTRRIRPIVSGFVPAATSGWACPFS